MAKTHRRDNAARIQARLDRAYLEEARRRYSGIAAEQITDLVNINRDLRARRRRRNLLILRLFAAAALLTLMVWLVSAIITDATS